MCNFWIANSLFLLYLLLKYKLVPKSYNLNQVFADHESSLNPISVPRSWIWDLKRRTVYFGTSVPTIFKGKDLEFIVIYYD